MIAASLSQSIFHLFELLIPLVCIGLSVIAGFGILTSSLVLRPHNILATVRRQPYEWFSFNQVSISKRNGTVLYAQPTRYRGELRRIEEEKEVPWQKDPYPNLLLTSNKNFAVCYDKASLRICSYLPKTNCKASSAINHSDPSSKFTIGFFLF